MSPRSLELALAARRRLVGARASVDLDPGTALSAAYYAMLYAARAALSEHDIYARTHTGTWHLFREEFVLPGRFDAGLASEAQAAQPERERADYDAWAAPAEDARRVIAVAERFVAAVEAMIGPPPPDAG